MKKFGLSGNMLKLIALVSMTVDHIGVILFPQFRILRVIGRLAFPIFAYMVGEGCSHTRSMPRYFFQMFGTAVLCQIVEYIFTGSLYQCVLVTFSLSILLAVAVRRAWDKSTVLRWATVVVVLAVIFFLTEILPVLLRGTDYMVDYGFWGVLLPAAVCVAKNKTAKMCVTAVALIQLADVYNGTQIYGLLALPLLLLYNGERGKWRLKYLFYIYYPAHLAALHLTATILNK